MSVIVTTYRHRFDPFVSMTLCLKCAETAPKMGNILDEAHYGYCDYCCPEGSYENDEDNEDDEEVRAKTKVPTKTKATKTKTTKTKTPSKTPSTKTMLER